MRRKALTYSEAAAIMNSFTYKPNCDITWNRAGFYPRDDAITVTLRYHVPDVSDSKEEITLTTRFTVPLFRDEQWFKKVLLEKITDMEHHERDEWFKFNGKAMHNPHEED